MFQRRQRNNGPCGSGLRASPGENNSYRERYWDNWQNLNTGCGLGVLVHQLGHPGLATV